MDPKDFVKTWNSFREQVQLNKTDLDGLTSCWSAHKDIVSRSFRGETDDIGTYWFVESNNEYAKRDLEWLVDYTYDYNWLDYWKADNTTWPNIIGNLFFYILKGQVTVGCMLFKYKDYIEKKFPDKFTYEFAPWLTAYHQVSEDDPGVGLTIQLKSNISKSWFIGINFEKVANVWDMTEAADHGEATEYFDKLKALDFEIRVSCMDKSEGWVEAPDDIKVAELATWLKENINPELED